MNQINEVKIEVILQGIATCSRAGYFIAGGEGVVAFNIDGWGKTMSVFLIKITVW